jgi:hypothetical protein
MGKLKEYENSLTVGEAGSLGGKAVLVKRGLNFFSDIGKNGQKAMRAKYPGKAAEWGRMGGRPRKHHKNND